MAESEEEKKKRRMRQQATVPPPTSPSTTTAAPTYLPPTRTPKAPSGAPPTTAAPSTTMAPTTTAAPSTTMAPTTTAAPSTTVAPPTTTAPPPTTTVPATPSNVSPELQKLIDQFQAAAGQQGSTTGLPTGFTYNTRKWVDAQGVEHIVTGGNTLINLRTGATSPMFKLNEDPTVFIANKLSKEGPKALNAFLKDLYRYGFYEGGRIGNGSSDNDISAVAKFMRRANVAGYDSESTLAMLRTTIPSGAYGGPSIQTTSATDLENVFQSVAVSTLGRGLTPTQIKQMVAAYQQAERSAGSAAAAGGVYSQAPSAEGYATDFLRNKFQGEAEDYRAMNVANTMMDIFRNA